MYIEKDKLQAMLDSIDNARVALIGDMCLDMYWLADMKLSELSRETPHYPLPIVEERYAPGGAGNAVCNIASLKPKKLLAIGVIGEDWRGDMLLRALGGSGIDCKYIIRDDKRMTNAYIKPLRRGISDVVYEDPRLDFEAREKLSESTEKKLLTALDAAAAEVDVICVSDQMKYGCITEAVRERLCELGKAGKTIIVDSRDNASKYKYVIVKPNEVEASRAFGNGAELSFDELRDLSMKISAKTERTALVTLGDKGCFAASKDAATHCPACKVEPPIDFCGAGDTFLACFAAMIAGGADAVSSAQAANICSAVTIKKIGTTGTASREEMLSAWELYAEK